MKPIRTNHLLHPETLREARITRPFHVGLRNTLVALAAIALGGLGYLIRFPNASQSTAWWVWPSVAAGATFVCFGHAYLASRIGARRANTLAVLLLFAALTTLILWLNHTLNAGR